MLTQMTAAAKTAPGPVPDMPYTACLWRRILCGLAAVAGLLPELCVRLQSQSGGNPDSPNADRDTPDGIDAPAKGGAGGRDGEGGAAGAMDNADGRMAPSKPGGSTEKGKSGGKVCSASNATVGTEGESAGKGKSGGKAGNGGAANRPGRRRGRQVERHPNRKPRGGRGKAKARSKAKARNKTGGAGPGMDDAASTGIMKTLAGDICLRLGLTLLAGLGVKFRFPDTFLLAKSRVL